MVVRAGQEGSGKAFETSMKRYPPARQAPWSRRSQALAKLCRYIVEGQVVSFGGPEYLKYLLEGTGIYGPTGQPIVAKPGKVFAIPITGAANIGSLGISTRSMGLSYSAKGGHLESRDTGVLFTRKIKGSVWPGKKVEIQVEVVKGFKAGLLRGMGK
jgi:hypothetical protein